MRKRECEGPFAYLVHANPRERGQGNYLAWYLPYYCTPYSQTTPITSLYCTVGQMHASTPPGRLKCTRQAPHHCKKRKRRRQRLGEAAHVEGGWAIYWRRSDELSAQQSPVGPLFRLPCPLSVWILAGEREEMPPGVVVVVAAC